VLFLPARYRQRLGNRRRQRRFAVVDVTNGANVYVRFTAVKFLFRHITALA
jgi:hypothetical protein